MTIPCYWAVGIVDIQCNIYMLKFGYNIAGCQPENDREWDIEWQFTTAGSVAVGKCPGLSESSGNVMQSVFDICMRACMYVL